MPVRLKITFLFAAIVFCILGFVCASIYFFASTNRTRHISTRLTNMAITTGNFLSREETFSRVIINKIDSLTAISFTRKTAQAYDQSNKKIYSFNDNDEDTLIFSLDEIIETRNKKIKYAAIDERDVVFYHFVDENNDLVIVAAGYDLYGHQNLKNLRLILMASFFSGTLVAIFGGYIFSGRLMKPLGKIADEVTEISAYDLAKRIDTGTGQDEWHYLADTLNKLLNRLQESFEMQSRFISNASHELSTPLTTISSQLEITLQKERSREEYKKIMLSVFQDIQQMSKLTHTLLEMAKASGSKSGIEIKPVRMDEIILRITQEVTKINNAYTVLFNFNNPPENQENLVVYGNEELLFTAINNITLNACKYSNNRQATISLQADDNKIILAVSNTGRGIPQNEFENIFQPFYRIEKGGTGRGFGMGLPLAKKIIGLHDGEILVTSVQEGETTFTIRFNHKK